MICLELCVFLKKQKNYCAMNETIDAIQDEIIDEFRDLEDWMDKYAYIIELGNSVPQIDEKYKITSNLIEGCQSRVWLNAELKDGKVFFEADSDAIIVKGIISLLIRVLNGHTPDEILGSDLHFVKKIGLQEHLSLTRSNGLLSMIKQMRMYALAFKAQQEANK